jgi:2'-5' RNA ligase
MVRSFIAIEIPERIRNKIFESLDRVRRQTSGIKWVEPPQMHLTLQFLGEVEETLIEQEIVPRLSQTLSSEVSLHLQMAGVGLSPSITRPRVFWVGLGGDSIRLKRLQSNIEKCLEGLPIHQEKREFHPHLTLGRIKSPNSAKLWHKILEEYEKIDFGSFVTEAVFLLKSVLTRQGANYTKLKEFKLNFECRVTSVEYFQIRNSSFLIRNS